MHPLPLPRAAAVLAAMFALTAACSSGTGLPAARIPNVVDTVSLYAIDGTPIDAPSAFDLETDLSVRTDRTARFDFAFNITPGGLRLLLPTYSVGLPRGSAFQESTVPFDAVESAPTGGPWVDSLPLPVDTGSVAVVRSRPTACVYGAVLAYYAKLRVLAVDTVARRIDLEMMVNQNCGYRSLAPGLPRF